MLNPVTTTAITNPNSNRNPELRTHYDEKYGVVWCYMLHASARPCYTLSLLKELGIWCNDLRSKNSVWASNQIRYHVLASNAASVYNLGGDLNLFRQLVQKQDREGLLQYAKASIDVLYANIDHFGRDITTISLVQGDALGGGFEAALSSDVVIAERSAKMGLPEVLFNLFPGMGAYSLLSRKIGGAQAERMILSGKLYTAEQLYDMGLVDVLAEDGEGEAAVYAYIRKEDKSANGYRALRAAKNCVDPITYEELKKITDIWVDAALQLGKRDLRIMNALVARQTQREARKERYEAMPFRSAMSA